MDDLQRQPADKDREQLESRIKRVHDEGRIGTADRDIRLANVRSAQSMTELDLMTRELDQLEATLAPATTQPSTQPGSGATPAAPWSTFKPKSRAGLTSSPGRTAVVIGLVVAFVVIIAAVVAVLGFIATGAEDEGSKATPGVPAQPGSDDTDAPGDTDPGTTDPGDDPPAGPKYALTAAGMRGFLATYRQRFGTSRVVELTFYQDYVIVNVPVPGKARQEGWLYRQGTWTGFGGIRATFPGAGVVDTNRLDIAALTRNIARARRTLNVEKPAQAYVIIRFIERVDTVPSVDIHVTNQYQESGYLATTLDGKVERAYPYAR